MPKSQSRGKQPGREAARARAEAKREQAAALIAAGLDELTDPAAWAAFLRRGSSLGRYSFRNQILLAMQCPDATDVAGYNEWQERGRQVRRGETGLLVLAPRTVKVAADDRSRAPEPGEVSERKMAGVKVVSVFDISQTDPVPGAEFRPAPTSEGKTFAEIREAVTGLAGDKAAAVLAAMDAGALLAAGAPEPAAVPAVHVMEAGGGGSPVLF